MSKTAPFSEPLAQRVGVGLAKLGLALRQRAWQEAMPRGTTPTQGQIVAFLANHEEPTLGEVAEGLGIRAATASEAVSALVRKGMVTKTRRPDDRRALRLRLTPDGQALAHESAQWPDFLGAAIEELPEDEQGVFLRGLIRMIRNLQRRGQVPVARMCVTCRYFEPFRHEDPRAPHHCGFVDASFAELDVRIDCGDHQEAEPAQASAAWDAFTNPS